MKKSVALLVSSLSVFALCSVAEGAPMERGIRAAAAAEAKAQTVKSEKMDAKAMEAMFKQVDADFAALVRSGKKEGELSGDIVRLGRRVIDRLSAEGSRSLKEIRELSLGVAGIIYVLEAEESTAVDDATEFLMDHLRETMNGKIEALLGKKEGGDL